jgi:hypothetical protein
VVQYVFFRMSHRKSHSDDGVSIFSEYILEEDISIFSEKKTHG